MAHLRQRLLCSTVAIFASAAIGVGGARAAETPEAAPQPTAGPAQSEAPAGDPNKGIQDIVVTAQRRSESVQKVPISVAVVTAQQLANSGVSTSLMLSSLVPSLQTSRQAIGQSTFLRGVGTVSNPGNESSVATYIDDVYRAGFGVSINSLSNIDHVEVLKGPQGTLFGRNATGGVIAIHTKDPTSSPSLDAYGGYESYRTFSGGIYATGALAPNLSANFALDGREQDDGWGHNVITGQKISYGKEYQARLKFLWTPDDETRLLLAFDRSWNNYDYGLNFAPLPGTIPSGGGQFYGRYDSDTFNAFGAGADKHKQYSEGVSLKAERRLPWAQLTSITAYRKYKDRITFDQDAGPDNVVSILDNDHLTQFSEEFRISSLSDQTLFGRSWRWMAGLYYLNKTEATGPVVLEGLIASSSGLDAISMAHAAKTKSYAGFADTTLEVLPKTHVTLGLRYTSETSDENGSTDLIPAGGGTPIVVAPAPQSNTQNKLTYRAVVDHSFTDDVMIYASYSRGFKSGGYSLSNAPGTAPVRPEVLDAAIAGLKSQWFDHRLQINVEGFNYEYKDLQVSKFVPGSAIFINAAAAHLYGVDLDIVAQPVRNLSITAAVSYLHGRYKSFPAASAYYRNPAVCNTPDGTGGMELPGPATAGVTTCGIDAKGNATIRSPKFSGSIGAVYKIPTATSGSFALATNLFWTDRFQWDPDGLTPEPAYKLLNASLTWTAPSKRWDVQVYCTNCTYTDYNTLITGGGTFIGATAGNPRIVGVRLGLHL